MITSNCQFEIKKNQIAPPNKQPTNDKSNALFVSYIVKNKDELKMRNSKDLNSNLRGALWVIFLKK